MLLVNNIRMPVEATEQDAIKKAYQTLGVSLAGVVKAHIHKLSVDARHGRQALVYSVAIELMDAGREAGYKTGPNLVYLPIEQPFILRPGKENLTGRVVVCGFGPAGLFAALELAQAGYRPLILERGPEMAQRRAAVKAFEEGGQLDENANIQFGEGGAGTFSDGKLTTRIRDPFCSRITARLLDAGAPEEIGYRAKPHIGTDRLQGVLETLREKLVAMGGEIRFNTPVEDFIIKNGRITALKTPDEEICCGAVVLAIGHSARDTFCQLASAGAAMEAKAFSVGYRIEHLQAEIDKGLYHEAAGNPALPPGEYQLSAKIGGRGVYTFCMCPGGSVVSAQSEEGTVVTNGMSFHARAGKNANAAVVAGVLPDDFGHDPFKAIAFQLELERAAYKAGGSNYTAPAESLDSFWQGKGQLNCKRVEPTCPRGVAGVDLGGLLPEDLAGAIRNGLRLFGRKIPGYTADDSILTGLETRTSSPVRILRGESFESTSLAGLYPCGEGAGYAGGIMSAGVDGIRVAKAIIETYKPVF